MSTAPQLWLGITLKDEMASVKKKIGKSWLFSGPKCDDQALRVHPDFEGMFDLGDSFCINQTEFVIKIVNLTS